jgi:hypothetical protein
MEEITKAFNLLDASERNTAQQEILVFLKNRLHQNRPSACQSDRNNDKDDKDWNWDTVNHQQVLAQALETGFDSDILLIMGPGKKEVKAHRFILSIFSPVLRKIFKSGFNEVCYLPELDPTCFKLILKVNNNPFKITEVYCSP